MACGFQNQGNGCSGRRDADLRPENALDALLDELQTFAKPTLAAGAGGAADAEPGARAEPPLRRLHSYPSGSDTDASPPVRARGHHPPKPPVPERHPELLALTQRRAPPPPPPRSTSRSPVASPTESTERVQPADRDACAALEDALHNHHEGVRQAVLEQRHHELLKKQKALQEQYARLQMIQRTGPTLPLCAQSDLKKTGSESNLLTKMSLNLATASGSMTHLAAESGSGPRVCLDNPPPVLFKLTDNTTNKVYETDIL